MDRQPNQKLERIKRIKEIGKEIIEVMGRIDKKVSEEKIRHLLTGV